MMGFKIMDFEKGEVKTLFHGLNGSRTVPRFTWLDANVKENASDGSGQKTYKAGWHVIETKDECLEYLKRFKNLHSKVIVKVTTEGDRWRKPGSKARGLWLCERMRIDGIVMFSASIVNRFLEGREVV